MKSKRWMYIAVFLMLIAGLSIGISGKIIYPVYEEGEVYLLERILWDRISGNIIGNPDFVPSFDFVDNESFGQTYEMNMKSLNQDYSFAKDTTYDDSSFLSSYWIDEKIQLEYSEGFIILSFQVYEGEEKMVHDVLICLHRTLEPDAIDEFLPELKSIENFEQYNMYGPSAKVSFRFYEDDGYEIHIQDMKMGH